MSLRPEEPKFYPFSLVLGPNFRRSPPTKPLTEGDHEYRQRLQDVLGPTPPQVIGQMANILADGHIKFNYIPGMEPHEGKGVTFTQPDILYRNFDKMPYAGERIHKVMRTLIKNATTLKI